MDTPDLMEAPHDPPPGAAPEEPLEIVVAVRSRAFEEDPEFVRSMATVDAEEHAAEAGLDLGDAVPEVVGTYHELADAVREDPSPYLDRLREAGNDLMDLSFLVWRVDR